MDIQNILGDLKREREPESIRQLLRWKDLALLHLVAGEDLSVAATRVPPVAHVAT